MSRQRLKLTTLWVLWGAALFLILIALSYQDAVFGDDTEAAWQWFLPHIMPTLALVSAVAFVERDQAFQPASKTRGLYRLAFWASVFYLVLLTGAVVSVLFSTDPLAILRKANFWLAPVQGIAASTLGVFYVGGEKTN